MNQNQKNKPWKDFKQRPKKWMAEVKRSTKEKHEKTQEYKHCLK